MNLSHLFSAVASNDTYEGNEGLSIVTFWTPDLITLLCNVKSGQNGLPYTVQLPKKQITHILYPCIHGYNASMYTWAWELTCKSSQAQ